MSRKFFQIQERLIRKYIPDISEIESVCSTHHKGTYVPGSLLDQCCILATSQYISRSFEFVERESAQEMEFASNS